MLRAPKMEGEPFFAGEALADFTWRDDVDVPGPFDGAAHDHGAAAQLFATLPTTQYHTQQLPTDFQSHAATLMATPVMQQQQQQQQQFMGPPAALDTQDIMRSPYSVDDDTASEPVSPFLGPAFTLDGAIHQKWPDITSDAAVAPAMVKQEILPAIPSVETAHVQSDIFLEDADAHWSADILDAFAPAGLGVLNTRRTAPGTAPREDDDNAADDDDDKEISIADHRTSSRPRRAAAMKPRRVMQELSIDSEGEDDDEDDEDFGARRRGASSRKRARAKRNAVKKRRRSCASDWSASSRGVSASAFGAVDSLPMPSSASAAHLALDGAVDSDRQAQIVQFLERVQQSGANADDEDLRDSEAAASGANANAPKRKFKCTHPGCPRTFLWEWSMREHASNHMPEKERVHKCTYCPKAFLSVGCLKSHVRIHTRKPYSYVCKAPGCPKKYCTSEGLRLHTRNVHEADKRWKCPSEGCTKSFVRQSDLRLHIIRIHSKERPYPCTMFDCEKSFACYSELKRHLSSHKDAKGVDIACAKAEASHQAIVAARR